MPWYGGAAWTLSTERGGGGGNLLKVLMVEIKVFKQKVFWPCFY